MLFSPAMIEALIAGRKTETRRMVKPQPSALISDAEEVYGSWRWRRGHDGGLDGRIKMRCATGDLIWVKEAHFAHGYWRTIPDKFTRKTNKPMREFVRDPATSILYVEPDRGVQRAIEDGIHGWYKRPGMFMFKNESWMTLRVTSSTIERLHEITDAGAIAEGVRGHSTNPDDCLSPVEAYRELWGDLHGRDAWSRNPWVSVTQFTVIKRNVLEVSK